MLQSSWLVANKRVIIERKVAHELTTIAPFMPWPWDPPQTWSEYYKFLHSALAEGKKAEAGKKPQLRIPAPLLVDSMQGGRNGSAAGGGNSSGATVVGRGGAAQLGGAAAPAAPSSSTPASAAASGQLKAPVRTGASSQRRGGKVY